MSPTTRRFTLLAAALATSAALVAGCASSDDTGSGGGGSGGDGTTESVSAAGIIGDQAEPGEPVDGGTLSFAGYSMPSSLDPAKTQAAGSNGGTEMASIYDLLLRYDPTKGEFVPNLAESFTQSDDHLTWTLTLRDGVTFSDGTPLDADAVVASITRYNDAGGANSDQFLPAVASVSATGPLTVEFRLNAPWSEFPALFAFGHGMILAPAAYADPDNFKPIGAGPFTVTHFAPSQSIDLAPREDYWNGTPHLDQLKFVSLAGGQPRLQAMDTGGIQMAYLRSPEWVDAAKAKYPGYYEPLSVASAGAINSRPGRPGADVNVRKAMALAIDPEVINQRAFDGKAMATSKVFAEWSKWHNDVPATEHDPDQARTLLEQAKAGGYDGHIDYVTVNSPTSQAIATAVEAMLENVGFDVDVQYTASVTDMIQRLYVNHDFDLTHSSMSISDAVPNLRLAGLRSTDKSDVRGYKNPEMDAALDAAHQAVTAEAEKAALKQVEQIIHDDVPLMPWAAGGNFVAWAPNVYGTVPSADGMVLLGGTWIQ
ncbi:ABC transporter substrate-binding protein [Tomitella cavernea]|uniref:ABC transporter substrate-binding protein n=1 Tax=Tomitella cavernea TaxID=1387982 RepID=A0ABP9CRB3_9ACTN|nr:ABC transporter substrate-binding protein [Tomitella cavernea]